eukprot:TRINITY_DN3857_c0_g1_i1.p1 TRINITY_DN3857_c0_g1~~TRINITY_DN3857_c0_g1_i1.p1  ORF type:complete len:263 (-),score=48.11 TRINITY_DN3857_c0_g1_i1:546-1334(-)
MIKVSFVVLLFCLGCYALKDPIAKFRNVGDCDEGIVYFTSTFYQGQHTSDSSSLSYESASGFYADIKTRSGTIEWLIMDDLNLQKLSHGEEYDSYSMNVSSDCETIYYQFEDEAHYNVVGICMSAECSVDLNVWDDECTSNSNSDCLIDISCGWCKGIDHLNDEDFCVPGGAFSAKYGIICDDYSSYLGHIIIYSSVAVGVCCLCCVICIFMMCRRKKTTSNVRKQQTQNLLMQQQQPVYLQPQQQYIPAQYAPNQQSFQKI